MGIDPQCAEAQVGLGILFAKEGKGTEADTLFRQAIENNPKSASAHANLGLLLASQGKMRKLKRELKQATRIASDDVNVLSLLANLQSKLGRPVDSTCTLRRLTELQPRAAPAHLELGVAFAALYSYQAALEEFSKAVRLGPKLALRGCTRAGPSLTWEGLEKPGKSSRPPAFSQSGGVLVPFALVERQAKNIPLSIKYLEDVVRLEPKNADAEFLLGQNWFELGEREKAIEHWKAALRVFSGSMAKPVQPDPAYLIARDPEAPKYQGRLQELEQRDHVPDRVGLLSQLAQEAAAARDWPAVIAPYQEALRECGHCSSAQSSIRRSELPTAKLAGWQTESMSCASPCN